MFSTGRLILKLVVALSLSACEESADIATDIVAFVDTVYTVMRDTIRTVRVDTVRVTYRDTIYRTKERVIPPKDYEVYKLLGQKYTEILRSDVATANKGSLKAFTRVYPRINYVSEDVKNAASELQIKRKFELALRRNGVPIAAAVADSVADVWLSVSGLNDKSETLSYHVEIQVSTAVYVMSPIKNLNVMGGVIWLDGVIGYAGKTVKENAVLEAIEGEAEGFALAWLRDHE